MEQRTNIKFHTNIKFLFASKSVLVLNHSPYSLDLVSRDYFLFPKLKNEAEGKAI